MGDIWQDLSRCKLSKATGRDDIPARDLCHGALSHFLLHHVRILQDILFRISIIIPVPKNSHSSEPLLTSRTHPIVGKYYKTLILHTILPAVKPQLDKYQFAYKAKQGMEDAVVHLLHPLLQHLEAPGNFWAALYINLISTFDTTQLQILWCQGFSGPP